MSSPFSKHIAVVFGTRPEAIKLAPVILQLRQAGANPTVITTGQHAELVRNVLTLFEIETHHDLGVMKPKQSLDHVLSTVISSFGRLLDSHRPDAVIIQGDTSSTLGVALAAFHHAVPVAHVEAGLRTGDLGFPFPEEMNRRATSVVSRWHFAPTSLAAQNLANEGIKKNVFVTGNTIVDAIHHILRRDLKIQRKLGDFIAGTPFILATAHRRESWNGGIEQVALGLQEVIKRIPELRLVFVTHPNPIARRPAEAVLGAEDRCMVLPALDYPTFLMMLRRAKLVVSDSGGVQEEAPTLGVPVLVTRTVTERQEGLTAGAVRLVGADRNRVRDQALNILTDPAEWSRMASAGRELYGDGRAAERIVAALRSE